MARKIRIPIKVTTRVTGKITYTQRREIHQRFEYEHQINKKQTKAASEKTAIRIQAKTSSSSMISSAR